MPKEPRPRDTCPESLGIKNSSLRRFLTLLGLKTTARLFRRRGACVPISKRLMVKSDSFVDLTEAATMRFVATNTSVPVPKVWCSFVRNGRAYIVMERIRGDCISTGWDDRSQESRNNLLAQLKLLIENLRLLQPLPGTGVESCTGGSLFDSRIPCSGGRFGPFKTIQEFHLWLRDNLQPSEVEKPEQTSQEDWDDATEMAARQDGVWPQPVFTHGDLNPSNILVRGDEMVGIIDWEFSGWYPHYWEYTSAWCTQIMSTQWQNLLGDFLEPRLQAKRPCMVKRAPLASAWPGLSMNMSEKVTASSPNRVPSAVAIDHTGSGAVQCTHHRQPARILIAKVTDGERLANIFRTVPIVQDDPNWRCRSWVENALTALKEDGRAVGRAELDWGTIETVARRYAGEKTEAGRFRDVALAQMPKPTWDMLENREIIP